MNIKTKHDIGQILYHACDEETVGPVVTKIVVVGITVYVARDNITIMYRSDYNNQYHESQCFLTIQEAFDSLNKK